jgi:hypothetical protein
MIFNDRLLELLKSANCSLSVYAEDNSVQVFDNDFETTLDFNVITEEEIVIDYLSRKAVINAIIKARS